MNLGCEHYKRKAMLVTPCCNKTYVCRFCHDNNENHVLNRKAVQNVVCMVCQKKQRVRYSCYNCGTRFGEYFCPQCKFYDDEDKKQFHCDMCGICRIGGQEFFSHCSTCNMCYNVNIINTHKCITNSGMDECGLCLEQIHSSTLPLKVPACGHLIHEKCFKNLKANKMHNCPKCRQVFD